MRRFLTRVAVVLVVLLVGVGVFLWFVGRSAPAWYAPPDPSDDAVAAVADRVEYGVIEQTRKARPDDAPWAIRVEAEQLNAWLSARLRSWLTHERDLAWPEAVGTPQVRLDPDRVSLALPVDGPGGPRVVVAEIAPRIEDDALRLQLVGLRLGRLAIPGDPVESLLDLLRPALGRGGDGRWTRIVDLVSGRDPIEPVLELDDGRRVRLVAVRCRPGALDLTCRTIPARDLGTAPAAPE